MILLLLMHAERYIPLLLHEVLRSGSSQHPSLRSGPEAQGQAFRKSKRPERSHAMMRNAIQGFPRSETTNRRSPFSLPASRLEVMYDVVNVHWIACHTKASERDSSGTVLIHIPCV